MVAELDEEAIEERITLSDILDLKGYQHFVSNQPAPQYDGTLVDILAELSEKGWLDDKEGEYELNNLTRAVLTYRQYNQYSYTSEMANCLRINFFTEQHDNLKDHLVYEKHLRHYIDFVQGTADPHYLDTLYKLVTWCEDMGKYYEELNFREKHFELAQQYYGSNSDFLIEAETDLAWNYKGTGNLHAAQKHAENALEKAYQHIGDKVTLTAKCESHLGLVLKDLGDYEGAKALLEKAMRSDEANFGEQHPSTAVSYSNLAMVLKDLGMITARH
ncbi:MAG: tetratricopeptide repeat protein, partial [Saprospiraceae bacterium]|nr:tetratricopeptide repeat protein [Saprospiraceae bacterium]